MQTNQTKVDQWHSHFRERTSQLRVTLGILCLRDRIMVLFSPLFLHISIRFCGYEKKDKIMKIVNYVVWFIVSATRPLVVVVAVFWYL